MPTDVVRPFGMRVTRSHGWRAAEPCRASSSPPLARNTLPGPSPDRLPIRPTLASSAIACSASTASQSAHGRPSEITRIGVSTFSSTIDQSRCTSRGGGCWSPLSIAARHPEAAAVTRALNGSSPGGGHACPAGGDTTNRKAWARSSSTLVRAQTSGAHASSPAATRGSEMSEASSHRHSPATVRSPADSRPAGRSSIALLPGGGHRGPSRRHAPSPGRRRSLGRVRA